MTPDEKAPDAYRTISEVAEDLDLPQHVLRFWETRFSHIRPLKRGGGRRYYRPDDVALIKGIRALLYGQGYTIRGVQRILKDKGVKHVQALAQTGATPTTPPTGQTSAQPPAATSMIDDAPPAEEMAIRISPELTQEAAPFGTPAAPERAAEPALARPVLADGARRRLEAAIAELSACRRIIAAARDAG